jgi:hypothetical protein
MLVVAACADAPTTGPLVPEDDLLSGLDLMVPALGPETGVVWSTEGVDALVEASDGPLAAEAQKAISPWGNEASAIYDARTIAGFEPGGAWAMGEHRYQGNKGRVDTEVTAVFDGTEIGSQSAYRLADWSFWLDFGWVKHISAIAHFYTNHECGLTTWGNSNHEAWWEAVPGANIATFGKIGVSTSSQPEHQPGCAPPSGGGGGGGGAIEGAYCWVSIWYDIETGEVLEYDILFCEMGG